MSQDNRFDDNEWSSLLDDWQAQPTKAINAQALLKKIKRRSWVIWLMSMLDVVAVTACFVGGLWLYMTPDQNQDIALLLLAFSVWGAVMMYFEIKLRRGTWKLKNQGNESILAFSIRRCEVAISVGRFFTPAMLSCGAVVVLWQLLVYWLSDKLYWPLLLWAGLWFAMIIVASKWFIKRKQQELKTLKEML